MRKKDYILLFFLALTIYTLVATLQKEPGYMDSEYYFNQAIRIVHGDGLMEPFIWNYLGNPKGLPVPGFAFWMPLTSFISALSLWIFQSTDFYVARIPFVILAAALSPMSAFLATQFINTKRVGWLAGGLTIVAGYYLPFLTITDNFLPYMFLGAAILIILSQVQKAQTANRAAWLSGLTGIVVGLMAYTRSEGLGWILPAGFAIMISRLDKDGKKTRGFLNLAWLSIGFVITFAPWLVRNIHIYNALFPPANSSMLWLTNYEDLFVYPSSVLSSARFLDSGFQIIFKDRLQALGSNLQTMIASGGSIFLIPLIVIGWWKYRKNLLSKSVGIALLLIVFIMSFIFPFAGERGGFFHSLSSIQIFLWAMVPVGLEVVIDWGINRRGWKRNRSWIMFGTGIIAASICLTAYIFVDKLENGLEINVPWNESSSLFTQIESILEQQGANENDVIMINDPPGYTLYTGRSSVMIPTGEMASIHEAIDQFDVRYLAITDDRNDVKRMFSVDSNLLKDFSLLYEEDDLMIYEYLE